jgi:hypothetical protein
MQQIKDRCPGVFMVCMRSKNKNVVLYELKLDQAGKIVPGTSPIEGYWLILEPSYQVPRTRQGITHDREALSWLDTNFAWGFSQQRISDTEAEFRFSNFPDLLFCVKTDSKGANAFIKWNGQKYLARSFFIEASDNINILNLKKNFKALKFNCINITQKPYRAETLVFNSLPTLVP